MKKNSVLIAAGVVLVLAFLVAVSVIGIYNKAVTKDVGVENAWAKVQTAYQRRADLIPNLVETVKGSRDFEQETQTQLAAIRSQAGRIQENVASARTTGELAAAGGEMDSVLSRLLVVVEAYPDLKSNTNFLALQDELAGTENRVKWERDNYNDAVRDYKVYLRRFPSNIVAAWFGFDPSKYDMFQADAGAEAVPQVDFT